MAKGDVRRLKRRKPEVRVPYVHRTFALERISVHGRVKNADFRNCVVTSGTAVFFHRDLRMERCHFQDSKYEIYDRGRVVLRGIEVTDSTFEDVLFQGLTILTTREDYEQFWLPLHKP